MSLVEMASACRPSKWRYRLLHVGMEFPTTFERYHAIRKAELFAPRGKAAIYQVEHPDESKAGHYPMAFACGSDVVGVVRLDLLSSPIIQMAAIRLVAIDKSAQGHGHGRALINEVEWLARNMRVTLLVMNANVTALGFYTKLGYQPCTWQDPSEGTDTETVQLGKIIG